MGEDKEILLSFERHGAGTMPLFSGTGCIYESTTYATTLQIILYLPINSYKKR